MEGHSPLSRSPELEPHLLMQFSVIPRTPHFWKGSYSSAGIESVSSKFRQQGGALFEKEGLNEN